MISGHINCRSALSVATIPFMLLVVAFVGCRTDDKTPVGAGNNNPSPPGPIKKERAARAPGSASVFRPFTPGSYWNTPMPVDAPVDLYNPVYIADAQNADRSTPYMGLTGGPGSSQRYAPPLYWSDVADPEYTIVPSKWGNTISVRIPLSATPQTGSDKGLTIVDRSNNQLVSLWKAGFLNNQWRAKSTSRYIISSNGLDTKAAGSDNILNRGHRGIPPNIQLIRLDEVRAGVIEHRLECFWHATGRPNKSVPWYYWPMVGYEPNRGGIVPEGMVLRIRPNIDLSARGLSPTALVIAHALQEYGCIIGDNAGNIQNRVHLERNEAAWRSLDPLLTRESLATLPWRDWEFIEGGYDPR